MVVAAVACAVGLVVVVWTLYRDDPLPPSAPRREPDWGPLPEPADLLRLEFGKTIPGYDPASVDAHVDALTVAYRDLLAEAPADVVARARRRAAARRGIALPVEADGSPGTPRAPHARGAPEASGADGGLGTPGVGAPADHREALRAEAALATLRDSAPPSGR